MKRNGVNFMAELVQTKSKFKLIGKVTRIDKDGAYKEGVAEKGKRQGDLFRSLRFGVKTSDSNEIFVSMYDYEPNEVFLWNTHKKEKDSNYKGDRMPFETWEDQKAELREQGYSCLQTRVGVMYDEEGKLISNGETGFVASEMIYNNIDNGDSVLIEGEMRHSTFVNRQGETVPQTTYTIKKLYKIKDIDFESEKFEEVTYFEQEMVFVGQDIDKKEGKMYVMGRTIDYQQNYQDTQFVVNFKNEDGTLDNDMVKFADAIKKRIKFGDVINVFGDVLNRAVVKEVEQDDKEEDNIFAEFGGRAKPKHAESYTAKTYISELSINGLDAHDAGVYTEEDFVDNSVVEDTSKVSEEFGGKGKNPFSNDSDEIDEDDLPF